MDESFRRGLSGNGLTYRNKLQGIIDKYSKIPCHDGPDVDFNCTSSRSLERYMRQAEVQLEKWESKSPTDVGEDSLRFQDTFGDSQLDLTHQDEADKTCASITQDSVQHDGMLDTTVSSLDEGESHLSGTEVESHLSGTEVLPEDQDEELEMTLRSNSSLAELYPSMINRIGRVWHRHYVTEAADSVLRRYRRWRQQSHRSNLITTFIVPQRNPQTMINQMLLREDTISPANRPYMWAETLRSPLKVEYMQDWQGQRQSPQRMRREQHRPVLVMDMSGHSMPNEIMLNETFTVSEVSQLAEQPSTYTFSPSRPCYPTGRASLDPRRLSLTARSPHTNGCSVYASQTVDAMERSDIYGSPVRQSPSRARVTSSLSGSPHAFSRSPRAHSMESFSREPPRHRLVSVPPLQPTVPLRMLHPQNSPHSLQPQLRSPQPASAPEGHHKLRRHLSFDCLPTSRVSNSPKKLDEDFQKLFHEFICQNKSSSFNGHPCRLCARSSEANKRPASSSLAALALSPHCSVLRKRHRELNWDHQPQSKRIREADCPSSPTSRFARREVLRRRHSASDHEQSRDDLFYGSPNPSMLQRFSPQQHSADAPQENWMSRRHHVSAADFSGRGTGTRSSHERRMASGSSRRVDVNSSTASGRSNTLGSPNKCLCYW